MKGISTGGIILFFFILILVFWVIYGLERFASFDFSKILNLNWIKDALIPYFNWIEQFIIINSKKVFG